MSLGLILLALLGAGIAGWKLYTSSRDERVVMKRAKRTAAYEIQLGRLAQIKDMADNLTESILGENDTALVRSQAMTLANMIAMYDRNEGAR